MRILLSIHHFLDLNSGAPGVTLRLAREFEALGHETRVISFEDLPPLPGRLRELAFPHRVTAAALKSGAWDVLDASTGDGWAYGALPRRARRLLVACRSHGLEHAAHLRRVAQARAGTEKLSWKYPLYHGGFRLWEVSTSLRRADVVLLLNEEDADFAATRLGVPRPKIRLVRNGISMNLLGQSLEPAAPTPVVAVIGRYSALKGAAFGARALEAMLRRHPQLRARYLGTGVGEAEVLRDFDAGLQPRIEVVPAFDNDRLPELLRGAQIKLFPTLTEGFGVALVEAMACGLAPVSTATPGPRMIVRHGHNGLLVPVADAAALAAALDELISRPALLERLRRQAHHDAQAYGWRDVAREQLAIYRDAAQLQGRRVA
ncbi:MAG: glycosyltransferase family 4 protein [Proteobacteria bacterium]|nr:glycosyltransferase family 4 protein [Pseudomonadota bacterium]